MSNRYARTGMLVCLLVVCAWQALAPAAAQVTEGEQALIDRHPPVLMLVEQENVCDETGEPYDAGPAEIVLGDPTILVRQDVPGQPIVLTGPTAEDLAGLDGTYYLDFLGNPLDPGCTYERLSRARMENQPITAHAHIAREPGRDGLALQYWLFYYFNDFNNTHEGDWEMIQVVFDVNTIEEALQTEPIEVGYAQHGGGEWAGWDDPKLEREGDRPVVYVARGSHASQFDQAVYLGWGENNTGFGCDVTTGAELRKPVQARLIGGGSDVSAAPAWVAYEGRWGQKEIWQFSGPLGPSQSDKWAAPLAWQEGLRSSSLAVPLTGALGPTPTNAFCAISATSSAMFRLGAEDPWVAAVLIGVVVGVAGGMLYLSRQPITAALRLYLRHFRVFLPAGIAALVVGVVVSLIRGVGNLSHDSGLLADTPALWSVLSFLLHIFQQIGGLVLIAPMAIFATGELLAGRRPTFREVIAQERRFLTRLVRALFRPFFLLAVLAIVPFGVFPSIYLSIQRAFIPHAVVLENAAPRDARTRSIQSVKRRWWRTATLNVTLAALILIPSPVIGLLLLIFAARSVEFVNIASSLVYAMTSPFTFVATTIFFLSRFHEPEASLETADSGS